MTDRAHKGRRVDFSATTADSDAQPPTIITDLRFMIMPERGRELPLNFAPFGAPRLALAFANGLRRLSRPPATVRSRSTLWAYANTVRRFFVYLRESAPSVDGIEDLRANHIDGFELWIEATGCARTTTYCLLMQLLSVLRQAVAEAGDEVSPDLYKRLEYGSAERYQRSEPRDAHSLYVARQLLDAALADVRAAARRIRAGPPIEEDLALRDTTATAHRYITEHGPLKAIDRILGRVSDARVRRGDKRAGTSERLHSAHYLTPADIVAFIVLLSLKTGIEYECCKALTIDCLRNGSARTIELHYVKYRAIDSPYQTMRVGDDGPDTPGQIVRLLIELTKAARRHQPSEVLWIYYSRGTLVTGIGDVQEHVDDWATRHQIVDDKGRPLRLLPSTLRKTHKAFRYLEFDGHIGRFAINHSKRVAADHYANLPSLRRLHETTVADAFTEAVAATTSHILTPEDEADLQRRQSLQDTSLGEIDAGVLLAERQDVWLASCAGFYTSPFGEAGSPCPVPHWGCLECSNAVITARKLPAILSFLAFVTTQREGLSAADWDAKFGRAYVQITQRILPAFSDAVVASARADLAADPPLAVC